MVWKEPVHEVNPLIHYHCCFMSRPLYIVFPSHSSALTQSVSFRVICLIQLASWWWSCVSSPSRGSTPPLKFWCWLLVSRFARVFSLSSACSVWCSIPLQEQSCLVLSNILKGYGGELYFICGTYLALKLLIHVTVHNKNNTKILAGLKLNFKCVG